MTPISRPPPRAFEEAFQCNLLNNAPSQTLGKPRSAIRCRITCLYGVKIWRFVRGDPGVASGRVQTPLPEFCRILFFASTVVRARFPSAQTESASPDKIQHHPLEISTALEEPSTPLVALQVNEPVPPQNSTKWPSARRFVMLYYPIQDEWLHRLSRHCLDFPTPRRNRPRFSLIGDNGIHHGLGLVVGLGRNMSAAYAISPSATRDDDEREMHETSD